MNNQLNPDPQGGESNMDTRWPECIRYESATGEIFNVRLVNKPENKIVYTRSEVDLNGIFTVTLDEWLADVGDAAKAEGATTQPTPASEGYKPRDWNQPHLQALNYLNNCLLDDGVEVSIERLREILDVPDWYEGSEEQKIVHACLDDETFTNPGNSNRTMCSHGFDVGCPVCGIAQPVPSAGSKPQEEGGELGELALECFGFLRSMDHHYGEEFVPPNSCAETALNNIRRIIKMPPVPSAGSKPQATGVMCYCCGHESFKSGGKVMCDYCFLKRLQDPKHQCSGSKPQEEGGCPKCHKPMLGEGWNPETGVRYFSHVNSEDAAVCDEDIEIPGPSQPVADGGGLQEWEALKAAAEKVLPGTREIRSNSAEVSLIAPAGTFNGWQRPNRTICRMHASIGSTQTRQEKIIEFEFLSQASPENILKLLAELASSQEALIALRERMQQAVEKLKPWLRTDCGCAVTEAIKGSSR